MGRSVVGNRHPRVVAVSGVRGVLLGRPDRSDRVHWVPRFLRSSTPSLATPICIVGGAPRAVLVPFPVIPPRAEGLIGPVTGRWSFQCYLKEFSSVNNYTLKYHRHVQPDRCSVQLNTREIQANE